MSALTREEIKAACEAVPGWKWVERGCQAWAAAGDEGDEHFLVTQDPDGEILIDYHDCDGIALLEATGADYQIYRLRAGWKVRWVGMRYPCDFGNDLTTAAVRAVNEWKRKDASP